MLPFFYFLNLLSFLNWIAIQTRGVSANCMWIPHINGVIFIFRLLHIRHISVPRIYHISNRATVWYFLICVLQFNYFTSGFHGRYKHKALQCKDSHKRIQDKSEFRLIWRIISVVLGNVLLIVFFLGNRQIRTEKSRITPRDSKGSIWQRGTGMYFRES